MLVTELSCLHTILGEISTLMRGHIFVTQFSCNLGTVTMRSRRLVQSREDIYGVVLMTLALQSYSEPQLNLRRGQAPGLSAWAKTSAGDHNQNPDRRRLGASTTRAGVLAGPSNGTEVGAAYLVSLRERDRSAGVCGIYSASPTQRLSGVMDWRHVASASLQIAFTCVFSFIY